MTTPVTRGKLSYIAIDKNNQYEINGLTNSHVRQTGKSMLSALLLADVFESVRESVVCEFTEEALAGVKATLDAGMSVVLLVGPDQHDRLRELQNGSLGEYFYRFDSDDYFQSLLIAPIEDLAKIKKSPFNLADGELSGTLQQ